VETEFANPANELHSGTTVEIRIQTASKPNAIVVDRKIMQTEDGQAYVYVVKDGKAEKRTVVTGQQNALQMEITNGLQPQDALVIEGMTLLQDGVKVKVVNAE
jgi:hypothetical protein